jgi:hypothetical protein
VPLIINDSAWLKAFPTNPPDFDAAALHTRLNKAYLCSKTSALANENTRKALTTLARFGLVVEKASSSQQSSEQVSYYVANTLLNFSLLHQAPCPHQFSLLTAAGPLQIPARSRLLLLHLSRTLQINIFLFSSRAKTLLFEVDAPKYSIGLFHNVDSYHGVGEYLVLAATTRPVVLAEAPPPLPPAPQYTSSIPAAVYRTEERKVERKRKRGEEDGGLTEDDAARHFKKAW